MRMTLALSALLALALPVMAGAETVTVFAAASLKGPLDAAGEAFKAATGNDVAISYGGSSALAKQIQEGAPADVFLSAAVNWMDTLAKDNLITADTRRDLWANTLVVVAHDLKAAPFTIDAATDLPTMLGPDKLAMALVDSVPAGQYGKEALTSLGLWDKVEPSVVQAEDVRGALALVASGEAPLGIVYATDAKAAEAVGEGIAIATFPQDSHQPIIYPGAVVAASTKPEARAFLDFLSTPPAADAFTAAGFTILP